MNESELDSNIFESRIACLEEVARVLATSKGLAVMPAAVDVLCTARFIAVLTTREQVMAGLARRVPDIDAHVLVSGSQDATFGLIGSLHTEDLTRLVAALSEVVEESRASLQTQLDQMR